MSDIFFRPESMIASINVLVRVEVTGKYLDGAARQAMKIAASALESWWKAKGGSMEFLWESVLSTEVSSHYKGKDGRKKPITARIDFEWGCSKSCSKGKPCPEGFARVKKGHVGITFFSGDAEKRRLKAFHYDSDSTEKNHPFSHLQTNPDDSGLTMINDIPRWPAILMTPVDVIESVIWDLWPEDWLKNIQGSNVASRLGHHHKAQTARIQALCESFRLNAAGPHPNITALHGIRSPLCSPLELR